MPELDLQSESGLHKLLSTCNPAELDAVTTRSNLPAAYLNRNEPPATRASAMIELAKRPGGPGLAGLATVLAEMFDLSESKHTAPTAPARKILIFAANPLGTDKLRLEEEASAIQDRLDEGDKGRSFSVESAFAVRVSDISKYLLKYEPLIVHFSGHGSPAGELVFENEEGYSAPVRREALANLFGILDKTPECVVLNACHSEEQAKSISKHVGCVVGMSREIGDISALRFSDGFYRGLAFGYDYERAFRLGCNAIDLMSLPDAVVPHFVTKLGDRVAEQRLGEAGDKFAEGIAIVVPKRTWVASSRGLVSPADESAPRLYQLWYGTNRKPNDPHHFEQGYGPERDVRVHFGTCEVIVPKFHNIGEIGSPWWKRLLTAKDDRLKLANLEPVGELDYWDNVRKWLHKLDDGKRVALVFIHGYNVTFEGAALRAAQLGVDLKIPFTAFFSWASKGVCTLRGYMADEATIEASEAHLTEFLAKLATDSGAERVHVIAHSMGNRALLRSLKNMAQNAQELAHIPFGQIFLAAPDVDNDVFESLARAYTHLAQRTTLYVSSKDLALRSSGVIHDHPRAGYAPPVTVVDNVDTVAVSNVDLTFLGHGYFAAARDLLQDMLRLMVDNSLPEARFGLQKECTEDGKLYWQIQT